MLLSFDTKIIEIKFVKIDLSKTNFWILLSVNI